MQESYMADFRAAPSTGIGISIGPILAFFGGIGIGKAIQVPILLICTITMNFYKYF